jgi:hypothetical protein
MSPAHIYSQGKREFVTVVFSMVGNREFRHELQIPILDNDPGTNVPSGNFAGGSFVTVDCNPCKFPSKYSSFGLAVRRGVQRVVLGLSIKFEDRPKCDYDEELTIKKEIERNLHRKCGLRIAISFPLRTKV